MPKTNETPAMPVSRLLLMASRCVQMANRPNTPDAFALQWRFAGLVLRMLADDATLPPDHPARSEWGSTYEFIRDHNRRHGVSDPAN